MQSGIAADGKCNLSGTTLSRDNLSKYCPCNWNSNCSIYGGSSKDENGWCLLPQQWLGVPCLTDQHSMKKIHQCHVPCTLNMLHSASNFAKSVVRNCCKNYENEKARI